MENLSLLKIMAKDKEDLQVLSACLQDSLVPIKEIHYDKERKQFVLLLNRYRWEQREAPQKGERIYSSLSFDHVLSAQFTGFDPSKKEALNLSLLALHYEGSYVYLTFSDKASLRLHVEELKVKLRDADLPWPAQAPLHHA